MDDIANKIWISNFPQVRRQCIRQKMCKLDARWHEKVMKRISSVLVNFHDQYYSLSSCIVWSDDRGKTIDIYNSGTLSFWYELRIMTIRTLHGRYYQNFSDLQATVVIIIINPYIYWGYCEAWTSKRSTRILRINFQLVDIEIWCEDISGKLKAIPWLAASCQGNLISFRSIWAPLAWLEGQAFYFPGLLIFPSSFPVGMMTFAGLFFADFLVARELPSAEGIHALAAF